MVTRTSVFLTADKFAQVEKLMATTFRMDLETNITITEPGDKEAAWKVVDDFAVSNGLPRLPDGQHYGMTSDRELVVA